MIIVRPNELLYEALAAPDGLTVEFSSPRVLKNYRQSLYRAQAKYPEAQELDTKRLFPTTLWVGLPSAKRAGIVEVKGGLSEPREVDATREG